MRIILVIILIVALGFGVYFFVNPKSQLEPLFTPPYVAIYGRAACGYTKQYLDEISGLNMRYISQDIDDPATADVLHSRMEKSGVDTSQYMLPVLDVNGRIFVRPPMDDVIKAYRIQPEKPQKQFDFSGIMEKIPGRGPSGLPAKKNSRVSYAKDELRLEGISLGEPAVAVINGKMLKEKDMVNGYTVISIDETSVKLKNEEGNEITRFLR